MTSMSPSNGSRKPLLGMWILLGLTVVLPTGLHQLLSLRVRESLDNWRSESILSTRAEGQGDGTSTDSSLVIVSWQGCHIDDIRVEKFAERLRTQTDAEGIRRGGVKQIAAVESPREMLARLAARGVPPEEGIRRLTGYLLGPGNLRLRLSEEGRSQKKTLMRQLAEGAKQQFQIDLQFADPFSDEFIAESSEKKEADGKLQDVLIDADYDLQVGWAGMHQSPDQIAKFIEWAERVSLPTIGVEAKGATAIDACYAAYGNPVALRITLSEAGRADQTGAIREIREQARKVGISPTELKIGGIPPVGIALARSAKDFVWRKGTNTTWYQQSVFGLTLVVMVLLTAWFLRSVVWTSIIMGMALAAVGLARIIPGWQGAEIGFTGLLALTFVMCCALTLCQPWLYLQRHLRMMGNGSATSLTPLRKSAASGLGILCLATSVATLFLQGSRPFQEFALHALMGILAIGVMYQYVLPVVLPYFPFRQIHETELVRRDLLRLGRQLVRWRLPISVSMCLMFMAAVYTLRQLPIKNEFQPYLAAEGVFQGDNPWMESTVCGSIPVEVAIRFDQNATETMSFRDRMELVREISTQLKGVSGISGVCSLPDLWPVSPPIPAEVAKSRGRSKLREQSLALEEQILKEVDHAEWYSRSRGAAAEVDAASPVEAWRISAQAQSRVDEGRLMERVDAACQSLVRYHAGVQHQAVTSAVLKIGQTQELREAAFTSVGIIAAVGTAALLILLHHPVAALLSVIPLLFGPVMTIAICMWCGSALDPVHLLVLPLGIGWNAFLFVQLLSTFRRHMTNGLSRYAAAAEAFADLTPPFLHVLIISSVSLSILMGSEFGWIAHFGGCWLSLVSVTCVGQLLFGPALMSGWIGRNLEPRPPRGTSRAKAENLSKPVLQVDKILEEIAVVPAVVPSPVRNVHLPEVAPAVRRRVDPGPGRRQRS